MKLSSLLVFLIIAAAGAGAQEIILTPAEWNLGEVPDRTTLQKVIAVENKGPAELKITLISTCDCLKAEPVNLTLGPGGRGSFTVLFDPLEEEGEVDKDLIIRTNRPGYRKLLFRVYGNVLAGKTKEAQEETAPRPSGGERQAIQITYFYSPGCSSCIKFLNRDIPRLERELDIHLIVNRKDIFDPDAYEEFIRTTDRLGIEEPAVPALLVGQTLLLGNQDIERRLGAELSKIAAEKTRPLSPKTTGPVTAGLEEKLAVLPVVLAGLLDGVNPCAFTTLIFLLSSLAIAGRGRREVLMIGLFFSLSVFSTYFLIGLGLFKALRLAGHFPLISRILKGLLVTVLLVFSALSLYDYLLIRRGKAKEILLQLPALFKKKIHQSIRTQVKSAALIFSSLILGFLVSVFELACTGQVYFPTIVYMARLKQGLNDYLLLGVYNLGFILPLIVVFLLTYWGVSSQGITVAFQRNMGKVKLGLAFLFLCLASLTVIT